MEKFTNRQVAKALRTAGRSVVTGSPKWGDMSNFWVIGDRGEASVVNCQAFSILGTGCLDHPDYVTTRDSLTAEAMELLTKAGIPFTRSLTPDQLFINGYTPQFFRADEEARWKKLNNL